MFTKGKAIIVKRVTAMVLAVLMAFSLMPLDSNMFSAAPQTAYNFTVREYTEDGTEGNFIDNATVTIYDASLEEVGSGVTSGGMVTIDNSESKIDENCTYTVSASGYKTVSAAISDTDTINVTLSNKVNVSVKVNDILGDSSSGVQGVAETDLVLKSGETVVESVKSSAEGKYTFSNLLIGNIYTIEVSKDGYITKTETVDLSAVTSDVEFNIDFEAKGDVTLSFSDVELYVGGTTTNTLITTPDTLNGNYVITYTVDNPEIITVEKDTTNQNVSKITALKVGTTIVRVALTGDNYNTSIGSYQVEVKNKEKQDDFELDYDFSDKTSTIKVVYGDEVPLVVGKGTVLEAEKTNGAKLVYASSNEEVATVDASGKVTVLKSGKVEITVTSDMPDSSIYADESLKYTIQISKASQTIAFAETSYEIYKGESFVAPVIASYSADNVGDENGGKTTYMIGVDKSGVISKIDATSGAVTLSLKTGTVTIIATREADEKYEEATAQYTLKVSQWNQFANDEPENTYYTINGVDDYKSKWYTSAEVKIVAQTGFELYETMPTVDADGNISAGVSSLSIPNITEGTKNGMKFYVRNSTTGAISTQCSVSGIKVDTVAPTASIKMDKVSKWDELIYFLSFSIAGQKEPSFSITAADTTSGLDKIYYYIGDGLTPITNFWDISNWEEYTDEVTLTKEQCNENVIYTKVVDKAGNVYYGSTTGLFFDSVNPTVSATVSADSTSNATTLEDGTVLYTEDVEIEVLANESSPCSGIGAVSYVVSCNGKTSSSKTIYSNANKDRNVSSWSSSTDNNQNITISTEDYNGKVTVKVTAIDNAGNEGTSEEVSFYIDTEAPEISVSYDNNSGELSYSGKAFFNASRTATITIKERNLNLDKTKVTITNSDGAVPKVSQWKKSSNGDSYTATVTYTADGDYTFDITCEDVLGQKSGKVNYGTSIAPTKFTIDKTAPVITVSYDNNVAMNDNYYNADRTATVTVREHNFDAARFNEQITATDNGQAVAVPTIGGWSSSGDTHTATITFSTDAEYKVDFTGKDKAGNTVVELAEQTFIIDKTNPELAITEISDQSANSGEVISLVVTATDTNLDVFTPELTAVVKTDTGFGSINVDASSISEIANGKVLTIDNLESDGIYSLTCTVTDKAGNEFSEVSLQREDGSTYMESRTSADTLLTFSVNRNGSVFEADTDYTKEVLDNYYVYSVDEDLIIYEVNTNNLMSQIVTLNGTELVEGTDYTVSSSGGNGSWMRYRYTLTKELFETEGEYVIVASSTDSAQNEAFSDVKNTSISFVVDRTAPIVTVTGLASNSNYQTERQKITLMPTDDGGILNSLIVRLVDADGNELKELYNLSGEELLADLEENNGEVVLYLDEGLNQSVQIICSDGCVNAEGKPNTFDVTYDNISVSASAVAIFFANDMVMYIGIGIAAVAVVAVGGVVLYRRRKKS